MKKKKHTFLKIILGLLTFFIIFSVVIAITLSKKAAIENDVLVNIPRNTSVSRAIAIFNEKELLTPNWYYKFIVRVYSKFTGDGIYAGSYMYQKGNTNFELLYSLFTGKQLCVRRVTFPEGIKLERFASIVQRELAVDSAAFMHFVKSDSLLKANSIPAASAEGYLMPDTYEFYWKQSIAEIVNTLIKAQDKIWNEKFSKQAYDEGKSRNEILTLASIIEAEAPNNQDKLRVSGVFYNRLKRNMPLQSDPTVLYALKIHKERVLYKDLEVDSPYNTYRHIGLPPGPINSPGLKAIEAALNPEVHDYLYFVAAGDGSGKINYSRTGQQHILNVQSFRRERGK
ncbi:MAG: endolytic transglycosylase MltG [Ignavibacteriae bacterium]|nr:endolytic transglycosylase MltG [Ignavibacteriota bacterium]